MLSLEATIYLKKTEEVGGMSKPGFAGMQPSFNIDGELIMCRIFPLSNKKLMSLGQEHKVRIDLPYGEVYASSLEKDYRFLLNIGGNIIGWGIVEKINH